jgi:hypothetical protein
VDRAFGYTGAALSAPEKIDSISEFLNNPEASIEKMLDVLHKKWGIGNNKQKP